MASSRRTAYSAVSIAILAAIVLAGVSTAPAASSVPPPAQVGPGDYLAVEVTGEAAFSDAVTEVTFYHDLPAGTEITLAAADTEMTVTSFGMNSSTALPVGGFFGSVDYPVTARATIDGQTYETTLEPGDGVVRLGDGASQPDPARFEVGIDGTNSPVTAGEAATVDATVTNVGGQAGTQTVRLSTGGATVDSTSMSLSASESQSVSLSWDTSGASVDTHDMTIASANDSAAVSIEVTPASTANFQITDAGLVPEVVEPGNAAGAIVTVENTGDGAGTQTLEFWIDDRQVNTTTVSLSAGELRTLGFTWQTSESTATGKHTAIVLTEDDSWNGSITVQEEFADFRVGAIGVDETAVMRSETVVVEARVSNRGEARGTRTVALYADGVATPLDTTELTLEPGESQVVGLGWQTGEDTDLGERTVRISSNDDYNETGVRVLPEYRSFEATVESGLISIGTNSRLMLLPTCEDGTRDPGTDECIRFYGRYEPSTDRYTVVPSTVEFPEVDLGENTRGSFPVTNELRGATGTAEPSGRMSLEGRIDTVLPVNSGARCAVEINVDPSTAKAGATTGPDAIGPDGTAQPQLHDHDIQIDALSSSVDACGPTASWMNGFIGLPAGASDNSVILNLHVEYSRQSVAELRG